MKKDVENMMQPDRVAEAVTYLAEKKKQGEYTISDYYAIPEDVRAELIDGVIYDMAPPLSVHQLLSAKIHGYLARYIEKKGGSCIPFFAPIGVQLDKDDKTIVEPDILIVCDRNQITRRGIYGAPDFVIEILSESTKKKDSYLKLMKYQNAGVREYWLVDPEKKKVIVYDFLGLLAADPQPLRQAERRDSVHDAEVGGLGDASLVGRDLLVRDAENLLRRGRMDVHTLLEGCDQMLVAAQVRHDPQLDL